MGGKRGQGAARDGHRLERRAASASSAGITPAPTIRSSTRSRAAPRRRRVAVGPARFGRLRQGDEQRRLGEGQPLRLLAEIGEARRADALDVAAIGREREVEVEDSALAEALLELHGAHHLAQLRRRAVRPSRGSIRRATCMVSVEPPETMRRCAGELPGGTQRAPAVDAVVVAEALVLVGDQHVDEARIDLVQRRPAGASGHPPW